MKELFFNFKYSFTSETGDVEGFRYIQNVFVEIYASDMEADDDEEVLIGKANLKLMLINQAIGDDFDMEELFDTDPELFFIGDQVFDLETNEFMANIQDRYLECTLNNNICILDRLVLIPEYRGYKISKKIIKDIVFHFKTACGLFVIQPFPLQFEGDNCLGEDPWEDKAWYQDLEKDKSKATKKLTAYCESLGFEPIKGCKNLLFYCPFFVNDKLDSIDMNEEVIIPDK